MKKPVQSRGVESERSRTGCRRIIFWESPFRMKILKKSSAAIFAASVLLVLALGRPAFSQQSEPAPVQTPDQTAPAYTPKFKGDPARSDSEAAALAYMRVVIRAQNQFNKHYGHYAETLRELVHSGTFTQRMVNPDRGDYTAGFKGKKDSYVLTMIPNHIDADHRSFYAEEDGKIHADGDKPADDKSPVVK